jgi:hypothetical protein
MEVLRTIQLYTEDKDLPFLLIGGHALNGYGISRQTGDIDFIVRAQDRTRWSELLKKLKYNLFQDDSFFSRFKQDEIAAWPIDLMYVDSETFAKIYEKSQLMSVGIADIKVVSLRHLLTLKIHALKVYQEHRYAKDYGDVLALLRHKDSRISIDELGSLCERYATKELFLKLKADLDKR